MKPALTKEEWSRPSVIVQAERYGEDGMPSHGHAAAEVYAYPNRIEVTSHEYGAIAVIDTAEQRHALAALALHGQPFGFTRDDVDELRVVQSWCSSQGDIDSPYMETWVRMLADRIEALLPPESE